MHLYKRSRFLLKKLYQSEPDRHVLHLLVQELILICEGTAVQFKFGLLRQKCIERVEFVGENIDFGPEDEFLLTQRQLNLICVLNVELV